MPEAINIQFNGKPMHTCEKTLAGLLQSQHFGTDTHVATAVNGIFVAKTARATQLLREGDCIEVVAPMQGG